ncbi:histidine phosphatase family protein [Streptomyces salinarius]|uniref:Histidine phosphatase family protein n=1 Tax=Streptomyces rubrogriseus TaxID=194673 RepID=A0A6G3TIZ9_9ACTN|nr:histidine phosphatase family protein [Streptomyces rubrogriseus]NEC36592.1 histidine phosphatase family protein [Streptomyces rubrogriseus]
MGELLLIRHGETEWTLSRRHTSRTDLPLTRDGEEQARGVAPLLAGRRIGTVLVSPAQRAKRTAELAGLRDFEIVPDLHEWDYGAYEGVTTAEIHRTRPAWNLWTDGTPPGREEQRGESPEQAGARADRVLRRVDPLLNSPDAADVVLVAHGHFLRVLTARRLGLPATAGALFVLDTASLAVLGTEHGRPAMTAWNITGATRHPDGPSPSAVAAGRD